MLSELGFQTHSEESAMRDAVIVEAVRTPVGRGKPNGALHEVQPADLLAHTSPRWWSAPASIPPWSTT